MPTVPAPDDQPHAHMLNSRSTYVLTACEVGGSYIDEEQAQMSGLPVGPTLVLSAVGHLAGRPLALDIIIAEAGPDLAEGFADAIRKANDVELAARASRVAHEANDAAGLLPGAPGVRCPGCSARLYGDVAVRGGCLACYPDLGPVEAAASLDEKGARR